MINCFNCMNGSPDIGKQLSFYHGKMLSVHGCKCTEYKTLIANNSHFIRYVLSFLLLIGNIEINPGPEICNKLDRSRIGYGHLKIAHVNACSLFPKIDLVDLELSDHDIVLVSETHLDNSIVNNDIILKGFQDPLRKDRNRQGGGVAINVKSNVYCQVKTEFNTDDLEILWAEVHTGNSKAMVGVIYRPPQTEISFYQKFEHNIQSVLDLNIPVFLAGDFNIDMLGNRCNQFKTLLTRLNLVNIVQEPTRITDSSATCIDLFVTNRPNFIADVNILSNFCSDHCPVSAEINVKVGKQLCYKRKIRKYDRADFVSMKQDIDSKDWQNLFQNHNINDNYSSFVSVLNEICEKLIPTKTVTINKTA